MSVRWLALAVLSLLSVGYASSNPIVSAMLAYQEYTTSTYPSVRITYQNHTEWIGGVFCLQITEDGMAIIDAVEEKVSIEQTENGIEVHYDSEEGLVKGIIREVLTMSDLDVDTLYHTDEMTVSFHSGRP